MCSGGSTMADALAAGIPVLTCLGASCHQRVGASFVRPAGMPECVAHGLEDYRTRALELVGDDEMLGRLRQKLDEARCTAPFYQNVKWLRGFERAIQRAWRERVPSLGQRVVLDVE